MTNLITQLVLSIKAKKLDWSIVVLLVATLAIDIVNALNK